MNGHDTEPSALDAPAPESPRRPAFPPPMLDEVLDPARVRREIRRWLPERFKDCDFESLAMDDRVSGGRPRIESIKRVLTRALDPAHDRTVLQGRAGSGKTTIAACFIRWLIDAGIERARWVAARDLGRVDSVPWSPVSRYDLAVSASFLVLDDLGSELEGAGAGTGLAAQRIGPAMRLIEERYDRKAHILITTALSDHDLAWIYGDGVARRVFERATRLRFG